MDLFEFICFGFIPTKQIQKKQSMKQSKKTTTNTNKRKYKHQIQIHSQQHQQKRTQNSSWLTTELVLAAAFIAQSSVVNCHLDSSSKSNRTRFHYRPIVAINNMNEHQATKQKSNSRKQKQQPTTQSIEHEHKFKDENESQMKMLCDIGPYEGQPFNRSSICSGSNSRSPSSSPVSISTNTPLCDTVMDDYFITDMKAGGFTIFGKEIRKQNTNTKTKDYKNKYM
jgi:hypothetical protein